MSEGLVIITPTCSTPYGHVKDGTYRDRLLARMLDSLDHSEKSPIPYVHIMRESTDWNSNYLHLLDLARRTAPLCLIVDSDGYFHPWWAITLQTMLKFYPDAAGWQLYNSPRLSDYTIGTNSPYGAITRRHASPHGLCFRTADYEPPAAGEWFETFIGKLASKHTMGFAVPRVSVIQHCGAYGINNIPGGSEDYDPNFSLNSKCLTFS